MQGFTWNNSYTSFYNPTGTEQIHNPFYSHSTSGHRSILTPFRRIPQILTSDAFENSRTGFSIYVLCHRSSFSSLFRHSIFSGKADDQTTARKTRFWSQRTELRWKRGLWVPSAAHLVFRSQSERICAWLGQLGSIGQYCDMMVSKGRRSVV